MGSWGGPVTVVNTDQRSGTYCVKVAGAGAANQVITGLTPNTTYILSGWGKVSSGGLVKIGVKEYGGAETKATITSTSYEKGSVVFTTGSTNTSAKIFFFQPGGGTSWGDDFVVVESNNLVQNPGFETGSLSSWNNWGVPVTIDSTNQRSGSHGVKIDGSGEGAANQVITGLSPNTTYTLSGWGKVANGGLVKIGVKEYGGAEIKVSITNTIYEEARIIFTTGSSNTSARIFFYQPAAGPSWGDDFNVVEGSL